jgi:hypothetical protein
MTRASVLAALAFASAASMARPARAECVDTAPAGAERPRVSESFPSRGTSGYAATLVVVVDHGRGESVLPRGLELQGDSDAARALKAAGFVLPEQDAGAGAHLASVDVDAKSGKRQTTLELPLLLLPPEPGRHTLHLPALPITVARASGDVVTLCSTPHAIVVDDPTASTPDAQPRTNPGARIQREEWVALKRGLQWAAIGVAAGLVLAWLWRVWSRRPRRVPPAPPPRPAWDVALERLDEVRHAGLLDTQRFAEFFDRVNDTVRVYLGARFDFDGLESTTDETLAALRRVPFLGLSIPELAGFLQQCDLVKFADLTPSMEECQRALLEAERVVRATMPAVRPAASPAPAGEAPPGVPA